MKTLSKRLFAFFMAFCMIVPMSAQSVFAADTTPSSGIPEGCVAVSNDETVSFITDPIEATENAIPGDTNMDLDVSPYVSLGTRVQSIIVYPLGYNIETNELFINTSIYKQVVYYTNFQQSAGISLSNSETLLLMEQMLDYLSSLGENYALVGWHLQGVVLFGYDNLLYVLYEHSETSLDTDQEERLNLSGSNVYVRFTGNFTYPSDKDVLNDYYYISIRGASYHRASSGQAAGFLFGISAAFNAST